jgi:hypothetical protein
VGNKRDLIDLKDRRACLLKPAGVTGSGSVSQSGVSKQLDAVTGNKLLSSMAKSLAKTERFLAEYALMVIRGRPVSSMEREEIRIAYPARFELFSADHMTAVMIKLQQIIAQAGDAPNLEREVIQAIVRQTLLGLSEEQYAALDAEIELLLRTKSRLKEELNEIPAVGIVDNSEAMEGEGSDEQGAGVDPTGMSADAFISTLIPSVM